MSVILGTINLSDMECKKYITSEVERSIKIINGTAGYNSALSDQQKAALTGSIERMVELHNRVISRQVQEGSISKEQGSQELQAIKDMMRGYKNSLRVNITSRLMG